MGARIGGWGCGLDIERGVRGGGKGRGKRVGVRG